MALKNNWKDLVDGESFVEVDPINRMAHAIIANEKNISSVQKSSESIQADNKSQEAKINELSKGLTRFENDAVRLDSKINENEKRITNLEKGIPSDLFLTDSSIAYSKNVPQNALPYAEVKNVGGMTRKCTNLLPYPYDDTTHTVNGITFVDNGDGTITANGTATANATYFFKNYSLSLPSGQYTISGLPFDGGWSTSIIQLASQDGFAFNHFSAQGDSFTLDNAVDDIVVVLVVFEGYTANNLVFKPMLNEGSTALPYEPYFEGLRSAPVTKVESVGVNLCKRVYDGSNVTISDGVVTQVTADTAASPYAKVVTYAGGSLEKNISVPASNIGGISLTFDKTNATVLYFGINGSAIDTTVTMDISHLPAGTYTIGANFTNLTQGSISWKDMMLNRGTEALPYRPYQRNTLPIPEAVRPKHGINETVYDSIEWCEDGTRKSYKRMQEKVFTSADQLSVYGSTDAYFRVITTTVDNAKDMSISICSHFKTATINDLSANSWYIGSDTSKGSFFLPYSFFTTETTDTERLATFKAWLDTQNSAGTPVTVVYELATPEITDISDLLLEDNFIGVEGNGTITMINQYKYNVPSEIAFMLNEV